MYVSNSNLDIQLADFACDYVENNLDTFEKRAFEEYLTTDKPFAAFVRKSRKGMKALRNAYSVKAADDFEEKLARRIAKEKERRSSNCASV